ncbi:YbdK family carboxylate-amine ligase [Pseudonocardiaceae bacterium YIM PH 21723]|nr:YbdK family carboxylate-amine ligase [Pseudonocardiaceae bacterium YIM PH 21723]
MIGQNLARPGTIAVPEPRSAEHANEQFGQLTLGVEEEFLLVDAETGALSPAAIEVIDTVSEGHSVGRTGVLPGQLTVQSEVTRFQIETASPVCRSLSELHEHLQRMRRTVDTAAGKHGLRLIATGASPHPLPADLPWTDTPRFRRVARHFGALSESLTTCGCHVHIGIPDTQYAVGVINYLRRWLPLLLAISGNSPLWQGKDTRYSSWRYLMWDRLPTSGPPPWSASAADYESALQGMLTSGAALDRGTVYWDIRLSSHAPTIEVRIADVAPTARDAVLLAALIRAMAATALSELRTGHQAIKVGRSTLRSHLWHAARHGLVGLMTDPSGGGRLPGEVLADRLVERVRPALEDAGDMDVVVELLSELRRRGTGADRQRKAFRRHESVADVIELLLAQTTS